VSSHAHEALLKGELGLQFAAEAAQREMGADRANEDCVSKRGTADENGSK
jgi:hypothetical protein